MDAFSETNKLPVYKYSESEMFVTRFPFSTISTRELVPVDLTLPMKKIFWEDMSLLIYTNALVKSLPNVPS